MLISCRAQKDGANVFEICRIHALFLTLLTHYPQKGDITLRGIKMVVNELVERISTKQVVTTSEIVAQVTEIIGSEQKNGYSYQTYK